MLLVAISAQNGSAEGGGLATRAVMLAVISLAWNVIEAAIAVPAGVLAGSVALVAFGASSAVEIVSLVIVLWMTVQAQRQRRIEPSHETALHSAQFITGVGFLLLAFAVVHEAGSMLFYREQPSVSVLGIVLAALSVVTKPSLAVMSRRTAAALRGTPPAIDAASLSLAVMRPLILLLGLCASALFHYRWADPAAALLMLPFIIRQGWKAIEESKEHTAYRTRLDRADR